MGRDLFSPPPSIMAYLVGDWGSQGASLRACTPRALPLLRETKRDHHATYHTCVGYYPVLAFFESVSPGRRSLLSILCVP